ncbi:murein biosynthesis integral membrane protein MurJ [Candidatus Bipolaricaulota bacterium]|nr:murein biosynthesis integral membrane protein MurJ [Candidatus Bipolaricaulota bacterium]
MRRLTRDVLLMAAATAVSRIFGLFRDATIASQFGATAAYDAFIVAFFVPHMLRQLLAEGALSASLVPLYTEARLQRQDENGFISSVLSWLLVLFPVLVLTGVFLAPYYVPFLASGFDPQTLGIAIRMTQMLFPFIAFVGIASVFSALLHAHQRFAVASLAPIMFNVGMILGAVFLWRWFPGQPVYGLALGGLLGAIGQLLVELPAARLTGYKFRPSFWPLHPQIHRLMRLMVPAAAALLVAQLNMLVDNKLASHLAAGSISSLQYAMRLFQLPLGVVAVSVASALFPRLSAARTLEDDSRFRSLFRNGFSTSLALLLPATTGLVLLAPPIIGLLFEHGAFLASDTAQTASVLRLYAVGILPYGWVYLLTRTCYAKQQSALPLIASTAAVAVNIALDLLLVGSFGVQGLALATALAGWTQAAVLAFFLRTSFRPLRRFAEDSMRIGAATAVMIGALYAFQAIRMPLSEDIKVLFSILLGAAAYALAAFLLGLFRSLKIPEADRSA